MVKASLQDTRPVAIRLQKAISSCQRAGRRMQRHVEELQALEKVVAVRRAAAEAARLEHLRWQEQVDSLLLRAQGGGDAGPSPDFSPAASPTAGGVASLAELLFVALPSPLKEGFRKWWQESAISLPTSSASTAAAAGVMEADAALKRSRDETESLGVSEADESAEEDDAILRASLQAEAAVKAVDGTVAQPTILDLLGASSQSSPDGKPPPRIRARRA